jgi:hypothetical protein
MARRQCFSKFLTNFGSKISHNIPVVWIPLRGNIKGLTARIRALHYAQRKETRPKKEG